MIPVAIELVDKHQMLSQDGVIITKVDSRETIFEGLGDLKVVEERRYGNTTLVFYQYEKKE
jgi:16S rRNA G966 N2-methylase RsmD